jgi:hypothetical protein
MIAFGIETNVKVLEVRSLRHRYHGLWYDLRSIVTASLLLLAFVRSSNGGLMPGDLEELVGQHPHFSGPIDPTSHLNGDADGFEIDGKFKMVLRAFEFWADELPDLRRAARVLREFDPGDCGDGGKTELVNMEKHGTCGRRLSMGNEGENTVLVLPPGEPRQSTFRVHAFFGRHHRIDTPCLKWSWELHTHDRQLWGSIDLRDTL